VIVMDAKCMQTEILLELLLEWEGCDCSAWGAIRGRVGRSGKRGVAAGGA